ncbi:MAG: radical SAM protein [Acutalibacteraceae bacterium]|nr:radical SAM protein [Acutalibacteraceae bacterium]
MDKPKRFLECQFPVTICNLECPYCYIIQQNRRKMKKADLKYSPEHIAKALRKERLGGVCWINICGAGETLIQDEVIDIIQLLLKEGHYLNITTNGTLDKQFDKLIEKCNGNLNHLHIAFSWHFIELKKKSLTDRFFNNIRKMKNAGASILLQINLCDDYMPYIDEIKETSMEKLGAYPQVALTRDESCKPMKIYTSLSDEEYYNIGKSFDSPLFDFTFKNFNVKRKEFCYAGEWSGVLNLQTGWLSKCYANQEGQNIFDDIDKPIIFSAVGRNCQNNYCVNSSHFTSLGIIPEMEAPTYAQLRNRKEAHWYTPEMESFLNSKLNESNKEHSKVYIELKEQYRKIRRKFNI